MAGGAAMAGDAAIAGDAAAGAGATLCGDSANTVEALDSIKTMHRTIGIIARMLPRTLLLLIGWSLCLAACSLLTPRFERPTLSVAGIELVSGNLFQQSFRVKFNIQNPNDRALPVSGLHASLSVGGEHVAQGQNDHAFVVPAKGDMEFDMLITANLGMALLKLANKMDQHADSIDYDVSGAASIDLPFLRDLPFHQTGSFSLKGMR
jgi:LEA14-like dessication related protein